MNALEILITLLKVFEGCRLKAYQDGGGVWTIGYGETLGVVEGMVWTQEFAEQRLRIRAAQFLMAVLKRCPQLHLESDNRQAACASLAYNIGVGAFAASSVCRHTMRCEYDKAERSFWLWNKVNGKVVRGLTIRRHRESDIYMSE